MQITTIGLDIAKNVFQVHGIDAAEKVVVRKQLRRGQVMKFFEALPPCLIGMEACATAHYWARELTKLGHEVRLMPAKDVKAYVKRNKNDAADAEAICEAVGRPRMRFVRGKSAEQQGRLMQHRARDLLLRQQTQVINALRAHHCSSRPQPPMCSRSSAARPLTCKPCWIPCNQGAIRLPAASKDPLGRVIATKCLQHVEDMRTQQAYIEREPPLVSLVELAGARTVLLVPM